MFFLLSCLELLRFLAARPGLIFKTLSPLSVCHVCHEHFSPVVYSPPQRSLSSWRQAPSELCDTVPNLCGIGYFVTAASFSPRKQKTGAITHTITFHNTNYYPDLISCVALSEGPGDSTFQHRNCLSQQLPHTGFNIITGINTRQCQTQTTGRVKNIEKGTRS